MLQNFLKKKNYFYLLKYFIEKIFLDRKILSNFKNCILIFRKTGKVNINNIFIYKIYSGLNWCKYHKNKYLITFEEKIPFQVPIVFNKFLKNKKLFTKKRVNFVTNINDASIFGSSDIVISKNSIINEAVGDTEYGKFASLDYENMVLDHTYKKAIINLNSYKKTKIIDKGIYLCGLTSRAWGHWYPEYLSKLFSLKKSEYFDNFPLIVNSNLPRSHIDSLKYFLGKKKIINIKDDEIFKCKNLIYSPCPSWFPSKVNNLEYCKSSEPYFHSWSPFSLHYIKSEIEKKLKKKIKKKYFLKIYLSRKSSNWGKLNNEEKIIDLLKKENYIILDTGDLSFEKQLKFFKRAEIIVAPAGSALNNLIFCNKNVKIIILCNNNYFYWGAFCGPLQKLGYKNFLILPENYTKNIRYKHENYDIDINKLIDCTKNFEKYIKS